MASICRTCFGTSPAPCAAPPRDHIATRERSGTCGHRCLAEAEGFDAGYCVSTGTPDPSMTSTNVLTFMPLTSSVRPLGQRMRT